MGQPSVPHDTDSHVFDLLVERWRTMTIAERVAYIEAINADVEQLARSGIRAMDPDLTEPEVRHELARRRYGARLADEAYQHVGS